jgi:hypothetical protein
LVNTKDGFQAALIEGFVVGHKGQALYQRLYLCPDLWEDWRIVSIFAAKTMNLRAPVTIIVWLGLNE